MRKGLLLVICLFLSCCAKDGIEVAVRDSADDYHVKYLFSIDGVKVYRFNDVGRVHYFIVGSDGTAITSQPRQAGKFVEYVDERIDTKYVK